MAKIQKYFSNLPLSFKNALLATVVVTVLVTLQSYIWVGKMKSQPHDWNADHLIFPIINYSIWLVLAPGLYGWVLTVLKFPTWQKRNLLLIGLSVGFTVGHEVLGVLVYNLVNALINIEQCALGELPFKISAGIFGLSKSYFEFWIIYFVLQNFHIKKKVKSVELKNAQLEADLLKAQLSALKNKLQPHFLFNSFHAISALMEEDVELAQRMISKLGALLRAILKDGDKQFISVREEVELAKLYLEVEQIRFKGSLVTRFAIDPLAEELLVPTLLIQPIIENAIKHGFYKKVGECVISIEISISQGLLVFKVRDNGGGLQNQASVSFGIGLQNTQARLHRCYGDNYQLIATPEDDNSGFCAEIRILIDT
jgi:sensor histidine kinase YesM